MLFSHVNNAFPNEYIPTLNNYTSIEITIEDKKNDLKIFDYPSSQDMKQIRPINYPQADVFIICFSLIDAISFNNVEKIWIPEMNQYCTNKPFILVGTKSDLRHSAEIHSEVKTISKLQGIFLKEKTGAFSYIECSALKNLNIKKVFESAALAFIHQIESKKPLCFIQ